MRVACLVSMAVAMVFPSVVAFGGTTTHDHDAGHPHWMLWDGEGILDHATGQAYCARMHAGGRLCLYSEMCVVGEPTPSLDASLPGFYEHGVDDTGDNWVPVFDKTEMVNTDMNRPCYTEAVYHSSHASFWDCDCTSNQWVCCNGA
eukprot:CAMPEP_0197545186 /NCGR_PEP_ID=MMETSP1320-20131121/336_1 /TAXON_ID=91990 /ORGANISM="Bolidomonas sp., Strain RCC2347" /LENGTH=145 /DNA_ID=CAMNT_0043104675 /DNA_START=49 /DNA_END=486 /DNA_ORIENTATION=+